MDIYQEFGNDLILDNNGNLLLTDGTELSNQRIIRRLLTNPLNYIDHPTYGAGLPSFIGQPNTPDVMESITSLITSQMFLEESVAQSPEPQITITGLPNEINVAIVYTNLLVNEQIVINFTLPPGV